MKTFKIQIPVEDYGSLMVWLDKRKEQHDLFDEPELADFYDKEMLSIQKQQREM